MNKEKRFNKKEIEDYLLKINDELQNLGIEGKILIVGGAALSLVYHARDQTKDIDAVYEPKDIINEITQRISEKEQINSDWLNDSVKGFVTSNMPQTMITVYSNLKVYSVSTEALLAMKLISARVASKDGADAIVLMKKLKIHKIEQLYDIVERYSYKDKQTPNSYYFIQSIFEQYVLEKKKEKKVKNEKHSRL